MRILGFSYRDHWESAETCGNHFTRLVELLSKRLGGPNHFIIFGMGFGEDGRPHLHVIAVGLLRHSIEDLRQIWSEASQWDVSGIYQQVLGAARGIAAQEEPVRGNSFHTSVNDCLLFEGNGSLVAPATRTVEAAATAQLEKVLSKIPLEQFFEETGIQPTAQSMLCQLATESSRRLRRAARQTASWTIGR